MMKKRAWFLCTVLSLLYACTGGDTVEMVSPEDVTPISWDVATSGTRALVADDAALQKACTPTDKSGGGEAVSVYGDCTLNNGRTFTVFADVPLVYDATVGTNPSSDWNYTLSAGKIDEAYWMRDAIYHFRACYPQGLLSGTLAGLSGTYNTLTRQKDLMVAYTQVNTEINPEQKKRTVPLQMNHALAAICFKMQSADETVQTLKSLSLSGLHTTGTFTYASNTVPVNNDWTHITGTGSYNYEGTLTFNQNATTVTHYTAAAPLGTYAEDGFILVIPQKDCRPVLDIETDFKRYTDIPMEEVDFEPGKQYIYTLTVNADGYAVALKLDVLPWNLLEEDIQFTEELTIASGGQMKPEANPNVTVNATDPSLLYINGCTDLASALVFNFQIDTPVGATWYASFEGDKDAFAFIDEEGTPLVNSNGISSASGNVGEPATLRVITVQKDVAEMKSVTIRIVVRTMDGRTIVAHDELIPISDKEYYTIRQNLTIVG